MTEDSSKTYQNIKEAPWLLQPHVHIRNPEKVIEKINRIILGGKDKLQIIFDFDRTLTKHSENGIPTKSSYALLEDFPASPKGFKETSAFLLAKYQPIESNPHISLEEKVPKMVEWWTQGLEVLKGMEWDATALDEYLQLNRQPFRDGTRECFYQLYQAGVPVLVFSAGIGDVVKPSLVHEGLLTPNVHIVANFLKFLDGRVVGYVDNIIHVFNKNEQLIENSPYFKELCGRSNVIVLGDSTGDASMADGVPHDTVLKIGFLNVKIQESLPHYQEVFDIVLAEDQTMQILQNILTPTLRYSL